MHVTYRDRVSRVACFKRILEEPQPPIIPRSSMRQMPNMVSVVPTETTGAAARSDESMTKPERPTIEDTTTGSNAPAKTGSLAECDRPQDRSGTPRRACAGRGSPSRGKGRERRPWASLRRVGSTTPGVAGSPALGIGRFSSVGWCYWEEMHGNAAYKCCKGRVTFGT